MINPFPKIFASIGGQPRWLVFTESLLLTAAIGLLDYSSGYEVSMFIFYGIPILAVAWWCDRRRAVLLAIISAVIWWLVDALTGHFYRYEWIHAWEPTTRFAFFAFVAFAGSAFKKHHEATQARIDLLERSRQLEREIIEISEHEQQRIGRDLHDGICQYFAAVGCAAASLKTDLSNAEMLEEAALAGELTDLVEGGVVQIRDLARGLVPVHMHEAGLAAALEQLASSVSRLQNVACVFVLDGEVSVQAPDAATHLYRIAQEAIHNAIRHGGAKRIRIELMEAGRTVTLCVKDNGAGFSKRKLGSKGMGLKIMQYRARLILGELAVTESENSGTLISCVIPRKEDSL